MSSDTGQTMAIRTIGRYRAFDELGRGAMGIVYRGFDPVIGRAVALKTLLLDGAGPQLKEFRGRLYREASAAGALSHSNIVTIFDIVEDGETIAVAMEFIEGQSLASIIAERGPLPLHVALGFLDQLCSALDFAGSHGVIHRDIKPANILITPSGCAKVTDFGVARMPMSTATQAGTVLGSPCYMSPEQVRGLALDARSDLFSAAVVFYEMITGERPFAGNDIATTMYRIAHEPPTPPRQFNAAISDDITRVLERALAKKPNDRFQTGLELAAALRHTVAPHAQPAATPAYESSATSTITIFDGPAKTPASPSAAQSAPALGIDIPFRLTDANGVTLPPIPMTASGTLLPIEAGPPPPSVEPVIPPIAGIPRARTARWRRPVIIGLGVATVAISVTVATVFLGSRGEAPRPIGTVDKAAAPDTGPAPALPPTIPNTPVSTAPAPATGATTAATQGRTQSPAPKLKPARAVPSGTDVRAQGTTVIPVAPPIEPPAERPVTQRRDPLGRIYNPTEVDVKPEALREVAPNYPAAAERAGIEDVVVVKVLVGPNGYVADVQILRGSRQNQAFDIAAMAAVRQWIFAPARKNGQPVASWYNVGVPFHLKR